MHEHCQNSVSKELIWILSWNFQRILKGDGQVTKRQYVHNTANTTVTVPFTTTSIATILGLRVLRWKFQEVYKYTSQGLRASCGGFWSSQKALCVYF